MTTAKPLYWLTLVLAVLGIAGAALAAHALRGRGSFAGRATLTQLAGNLVALEVKATGNVTHLGKSTVQLHTIANFNVAPPIPVPPTTGVITAANGDTIAFRLRWTLQEVAPGVVTPSGTFDITGGTGRFQGATGSGDYQGIVNLNTGEVSAEITAELVP